MGGARRSSGSGCPARLFGALVEPGTALGPLLAAHGVDGAPLVRAVAGHDTASAFAAAPVVDDDGAILSSGTWSLLGLELPAPELGPAAAAANLTNERGVDATTRLLKNVMGLWLVQECRRAWGGLRLRRAAPSRRRGARRRRAASTPTTRRSWPRATCRRGSPLTASAAASGRPRRPARRCAAILVSLACKYRIVLRSLERVTGRQVRRVHIIGGGARNALLCQLTADVLELPVLAGPVEATALGNVLVQARGAGLVGSLAELRAIAAASARPQTFEPAADRAAEYERFLAVTRLADHAGAAAP